MEMITTRRRGLPVVHVDGRDYFVDRALREFRSPGTRLFPAEFVPFETQKGQAIWEQCLNAIRRDLITAGLVEAVPITTCAGQVVLNQLTDSGRTV